MQLTDKVNSKNKPTANIKAALTMATCALLGTDAIAQGKDDKAWDIDTAVLYYGETDRVTATEAVISGTKEFEDDHFLNLKFTVDVLTGASANGAVAQPNVQTFTRPSGNGQFDVAAGETPLDDTFRDTRLQLNAQWTQPWTDNSRVSAGIHLSKEYDYLSLGLNTNLAFDFNNKNSTLSFGVSHFKDTFSPEGGIPEPFEPMVLGAYFDEDDYKNRDDDDDDDYSENQRLVSEDNKSTTDLLIGFTQVINRRMLMQLNYSHSLVDGYLSDPFKVLSIVSSDGLTQDLVYENRPDKRTKQSVYWQTKYHFDNSIIDTSYRYMWDDWDIKSHTVDTRFRYFLGDDSYIEPHIRYYHQQAAEFYQPFLNADEALPEFASADYRIGEMSAYTIGFKYGTKLDNGHDFSFRLEYYAQRPTDAGFAQPGALAGLDLYSGVDAIVAQVSYSF